MILSLRDQAEHMQRLYPDFRVAADCGWLIVWEGPLQPLHQTYIVRILYVLAREIGGCFVQNYGPRVTVIEPRLRRRREKPGQPIPTLSRPAPP